jgi:erythromycin esterase
LLTWLRAFNQAHTAAPVRFVGADILASRGEETAEEARRTYESVQDRALPAAEVQRAKVVMASHAFYACPPERRFAYRDQQMAENTIWWHEQTGSRIVYWAHNAHTANDQERMSTGAHLRTRFGHRYLSIAVTFDHGRLHVFDRAALNGGTPAVCTVPSPARQFTDAAFGTADFLLDLRCPASEALRLWLSAPARLRAVGPAYTPATDTDHHMTAGALRGWLDAIIHLGQVTPSRLLTLE